MSKQRLFAVFITLMILLSTVTSAGVPVLNDPACESVDENECDVLEIDSDLSDGVGAFTLCGESFLTLVLTATVLVIHVIL